MQTTAVSFTATTAPHDGMTPSSSCFAWYTRRQIFVLGAATSALGRALLDSTVDEAGCLASWSIAKKIKNAHSTMGREVDHDLQLPSHWAHGCYNGQLFQSSSRMKAKTLGNTPRQCVHEAQIMVMSLRNAFDCQNSEIEAVSLSEEQCLHANLIGWPPAWIFVILTSVVSGFVWRGPGRRNRLSQSPRSMTQ